MSHVPQTQRAEHSQPKPANGATQRLSAKAAWRNLVPASAGPRVALSKADASFQLIVLSSTADCAHDHVRGLRRARVPHEPRGHVEREQAPADAGARVQLLDRMRTAVVGCEGVTCTMCGVAFAGACARSNWPLPKRRSSRVSQQQPPVAARRQPATRLTHTRACHAQHARPQVLPVAEDTVTIRSLDWDRDRFDIEFGCVTAASCWACCDRLVRQRSCRKQSRGWAWRSGPQWVSPPARRPSELAAFPRPGRRARPSSLARVRARALPCACACRHTHAAWTTVPRTTRTSSTAPTRRPWWTPRTKSSTACSWRCVCACACRRGGEHDLARSWPPAPTPRVCPASRVWCSFSAHAPPRLPCVYVPHAAHATRVPYVCACACKALEAELASTGRSLDYIFVSHTEPDHSGLIPDVLDRHPEAVVCGSKVGIGHAAERCSWW